MNELEQERDWTEIEPVAPTFHDESVELKTDPDAPKLTHIALQNFLGGRRGATAGKRLEMMKPGIRLPYGTEVGVKRWEQWTPTWDVKEGYGPYDPDEHDVNALRELWLSEPGTVVMSGRTRNLGSNFLVVSVDWSGNKSHILQTQQPNAEGLPSVSRLCNDDPDSFTNLFGHTVLVRTPLAISRGRAFKEEYPDSVDICDECQTRYDDLHMDNKTSVEVEEPDDEELPWPDDPRVDDLRDRADRGELPTIVLDFRPPKGAESKSDDKPGEQSDRSLPEEAEDYESARVCPACGWADESNATECPDCGAAVEEA